MPNHNEYCCYICRRNGVHDKLDRHEIFHGAYREKSKSMGLWVSICHSRCHIFGKHAVHNDFDTDEMLKRDGQLVAMEYYGWDEERFIKEFGRSYV